jgi:purine-binding chemotaxis protein CheW
MSHRVEADDTQDPQQVLRNRARALARSVERADDAQAFLAVLEFRLGGERYAIETRYVVEVLPLQMLTPLPCTPPFIAGLVNVRGRIVTVLDLKKFFGLPGSGLTDSHRVIHVESHGIDLGLLADTGVALQRIGLAALHPPPPVAGGRRAHYLRGVTGDPVMVLDMGRILADPGIIVHEEVDQQA